MSQRNPMNERYQNNKPQGQTRKSAASAKPVTKAASSVRTAPTKPAKPTLMQRLTGKGNTDTDEKSKKKHEEEATTKDERKEERKRRRAIVNYVPDTPEFKRLNRKRYIYSGIGFAGMIVAIIVSLLLPEQVMLSIGIMIVAWVFFFIGIRIDSHQLRPLRQRGYEAAQKKAQKHNKQK